MVRFKKLFNALAVCIIYLSQAFCTNLTSNNQTYINVLNEVPQHITKLENISFFPADSDPKYLLKLIPKQTYGELGEPYLNRVMGLSEDDNGKLVIWNSDINYEMSLFLFNKDGTYHKKISRQGKGPGEYGFIGYIEANYGKLYVFDDTNKRLNMYNTDNYSFEYSSLIESWEILDHEDVEGMSFGGIVAANNGKLFVRFYSNLQDSDRTIFKYLLINSTGNKLNFQPFNSISYMNLNKTRSSVPNSLLWLPFMGHTLMEVSKTNELISVWNQDFLIKKYNENGIYQSAIYYPIKGIEFDLNDYTRFSGYTNADVKKALESNGEMLPDFNTIISELKVDDENRIWIAIPTTVKSDNYNWLIEFNDDMDDNFEWWVLNESGELLAKFLHPRGQKIFEIKGGYLYSKKTNDETGTEFVTKYKIDFTEK